MLADPATSAAVRAPLLRHTETCATCRGVVVAMFRGEGKAAATSAAASTAAVAPADAGDREIASGATIGRYVLERQLGVGGMGVVYAAHDPELDRPIAIKLLRPGRSDAAHRLRLQREAQAAARVTHPNVVVVHDVGVHGGQVYVTMELVRGATLRASVGRRRSWREGIALILDAGRGLAAVHAAGLVHRDFKPDNVLVGDDGRVRVTDFGMVRASHMSPDAAATASSPLAQTMTATGAFIGTPAYAAPEQLDGHDADARADQFAFAVTAWEVLFGQRPFHADDLAGLRRAIAAGAPAAGPAERAVPGRVIAALRRGLAADPRDRFPSMDELLRALTAATRHRRRRRLVAGGALALGLGLLLVAARPTGARAPAGPCAALARGLDQTWNDALRARLTQAFAATGLPAARQRAAVVVAALDRRARAWRIARADVCVLHAIAEPSSPTVAARATCLAERRAELGELATALVDADPAVIERAPDAVGALTSVATCGEAAARATTAPPPALERAAAAARRALGSAEVRLSLRGPAAVRAELIALEARVATLELPPLTAALRLALARAAWLEGDAWSAARELRDATHEATGARDAWTATRARIARLPVLVATGELDEAQAVADRAVAARDQLAGDGPLALELRLGLAALAEAQGRLTDARALSQRALADVVEAAPGSPAEARLRTRLARLEAALGRPVDGAEQQARADAVWRALDGADGDVDLRLRAAWAWARDAGDVRASREFGERASRRAPDQAPAAQLAAVHRGVAAAAATSLDWPAARDHARRAAALALAAARAGEAAADLGEATWASQQLGEFVAALADARGALAAATTDGSDVALAAAHLDLGRALALGGRLDDALRELRWVAERVSDDGAVRATRGLARLAAAELIGQGARADATQAESLARAGRADLAATPLCFLAPGAVALVQSSHGFLGALALRPESRGTLAGRLFDDPTEGAWSAVTGALSLTRTIDDGYVQVWRASVRRAAPVIGWFVEGDGGPAHPNRFRFAVTCGLIVEAAGRRDRLIIEALDRDGNLRGSLGGDPVAGRWEHPTRALRFTRALTGGGRQHWTGTLTGELTFAGTHVDEAGRAAPVAWTMHPE